MRKCRDTGAGLFSLILLADSCLSPVSLFPPMWPHIIKQGQRFAPFGPNPLLNVCGDANNRDLGALQKMVRHLLSQPCCWDTFVSSSRLPNAIRATYFGFIGTFSLGRRGPCLPEGISLVRKYPAEGRMETKLIFQNCEYTRKRQYDQFFCFLLHRHKLPLKNRPE